MKKQLFSYSIIAALLVIAISSCKKETAATPDDPNIVYKNINKSFDVPSNTVSADSVDLNDDGVYEFIAGIVNQGADTGGVEMGGLHHGFQISGITSGPLPNPVLYQSGQTSPISSAVYLNDLYVGIKTGGYRIGLLTGQSYLVFRFTTGTKYQYGWMKVSIDSTFHSFRILEYAYCLTPETAITVGAK